MMALPTTFQCQLLVLILTLNSLNSVSSKESYLTTILQETLFLHSYLLLLCAKHVSLPIVESPGAVRILMLIPLPQEGLPLQGVNHIFR